MDINTEVKSIAVTKKGVYFAFRDQGACISVLAVKVYYITCQAVTENFAHFNETPTGREVTIIEQQTGVCVENAEATETPTYLCKGDGKWTILTGGCRCKVGFEPDHERQTCNVCPVGTFRSAEVAKCTACPANSGATTPGSAVCACHDGHYRHPRDGRHMPCYKPPGKPVNITLLFVDQTSAIIVWSSPPRVDQINEAAGDGQRFRNDIVFRAKCAACTGNVVLSPATDTFNDTKLTLTNLEPVTTYTIQIHTLNGVSYVLHASSNETDDSATSTGGNQSPDEHPSSQQPAIKTEYAEFTFTTESAIQSTVFNARILSVTSKEVDLVWERPAHSDSPVDFYEVRWFARSTDGAGGDQSALLMVTLSPNNIALGANKTTLSTKEPKAHVDGLLENTEYGFQVRCKTLSGWGTYSQPVYAQTLQSVSPGKVSSLLLFLLLLLFPSLLSKPYYSLLFSLRRLDADAHRGRCHCCRCLCTRAW